MSDDKKTLCKFKKEKTEEQMETLKKMVRNPQFICSKCGRAANDKKHLCKPVTLE